MATGSRSGARARFAVAALFLLPALLLLGALVVYPIVATVLSSFRDGTGHSWVGTRNYHEMFSNHRVLVAIRNNVVWVVVVPAAVTALGLLFAVLSERISFERAFKTVVFMPMAVSLLAGGVIWRVVYEQDPHRGLMNAGINSVVKVFRPPGQYAGAQPSVTIHPTEFGLVALPPTQVPKKAEQAVVPPESAAAITGVAFRDFRPGGGGIRGAVDTGELGLPGAKVDVRDARTHKVLRSGLTESDGTFRIARPERAFRVELAASNFRAPWAGIDWLGPTLITPAILAAYIWIWAGFAMMVLAAGLAAIPREVLEAARVDGATEWQTFRRVTVPLLRPEMGVVIVTMVIYVLKVFDIVLVVAPPEVQSDANVIALEMWRTAFGARDQGLGSAVAVMLFALVLPVMVLNLRRFRAERA